MASKRFAIFGARFWARFQLAAWGESDRQCCVASYNRTREKPEALARKFGVPAVYGCRRVYPRVQGVHHPHSLGPRDKGRLWRVRRQSLPRHDLGEAQAGGLHPHLARPGLGIGRLARLQFLGTAVSRHPARAHSSSSRRRTASHRWLLALLMG
ncbi:MAG: hypothetical protein M3Q65_19605 [Chloroflexota bacterium]|nr:hypothetical protein [Chloroflexota bacterium]